MNAATFAPEPWVIVLVALLAIACFENQRGVRAAGRMPRASSDWHPIVRLVAIIVGIAAVVVGVTFVVSFGVQYGWISAVVLVATSIVAPMLWGAVVRHENPWLGIVGTVATLPVLSALASYTNWFGVT